jgi:hypothetical protein
MWIQVNFAKKGFSYDNLADEFAKYLNSINVTRVIILDHTDKDIIAIGWVEPEQTYEARSVSM